jgi:hypothetical protein
MSKITEKQILYIFEHNIKDVCKIGIGALERAKKAHRYFDSNEKSKKNKLAIFDFESINVLVIEKICKQVLKRINSTEFYQIEFYKACILFKCLGGNLDDENSQNIDRSKISIKITSSATKNEIPLTTRFAEQIFLLIDEDNNEKMDKIKNLLNNNGNRNILLTGKEFDEFNKHGTRTGWKKYKDWYYRTGIDATSLSNFIKIIEQNINN